jgi:hypothetical protein
METAKERLNKWKPGCRFAPQKNDFIFVGRTGFYTQYDRVALIVKWRDDAEKIALNAILLMMVGDL